MSNPNPLPEGRVRLSDIPAPKYADRTRAVIGNEKDKHLIAAHASTIARRFSWGLHKINITEGSIADYYNEAKGKATFYGLPWDRRAVAMIIKSQVSDEKTYAEVSSFLDQYDTSKLSNPERTVVQMVQDTAKKESKRLLDYWRYYFRADSGYQANLDPKLVQLYDLDPAPVTFETMGQAKANRDLSKHDSDD